MADDNQQQDSVAKVANVACELWERVESGHSFSDKEAADLIAVRALIQAALVRSVENLERRKCAGYHKPGSGE